MWNGPYFRKLFLIISHQARCVLQYAVETWIKAFRFFIFFASSTTENTAPTLMAIAWIWFKIVLKNFSFVWLFFISRNYLIICFCKITLSRSSLNLTVAALWKTTLTSSSNNLRVQLQFNLHFHLNLSKYSKNLRVQFNLHFRLNFSKALQCQGYQELSRKSEENKSFKT